MMRQVWFGDDYRVKERLFGWRGLDVVVSSSRDQPVQRRRSAAKAEGRSVRGAARL